MRSLSRKIIKANDLVEGDRPVTIVAPWSMAGWDEVAASGAVADGGFDEGPAGEDVRHGPEPETAVDEGDSEVRERAEQLLAEAREEAERLVEEARTAADEIRASARQEGYDAGFADGEAQGRAEGRARAEAELEAAVNQAKAVLSAALRERAGIVAASRDDVLKLVRRVAEKITRAEARLDPSCVERAIDAGLRLVTERSSVLIRVNPDDVDRARQGVPNYLKYFTPSAVVEVCADPRVSAGGCLIETNAGNVDIQLETELEEVFAQLEERIYGGG